jgi:hypothetical protein
MRREFDRSAPSTTADQRPMADGYTRDPYIYDKTLPDDAPVTAQHMVIPAAKVRNYRERLKHHFDGDAPPSICNILAALLWIHVTRARASRIGVCGCATTSGGGGTGDCEHKRTQIGIATDLRKRRDPQLSSEYMGNGALFSKGTLSIADITNEAR